ncbi:Verru_Chthon cassette protein D [Verrucomicrobium sp. GAS474]|nr:Verru_Chthon cassette protein D [Verrucomicrobium sp. GAS474]
MVVVALVSLLAFFSLPAFHSAQAASSLASSKQIVVAELNLARQTALSRGLGVEVRFYELPGYGELAQAGPSTFRAMQLFTIDGATTNVLDKVAFFPRPAKGSPDPTASPLLQGAAGGTFRLPEVGLNYRYTSLFFAPDGSLQGLGSTNVFLTLVLDHAPIREGNLPANFVTVQIDPLTGRVFTYSP